MKLGLPAGTLINLGTDCVSAHRPLSATVQHKIFQHDLEETIKAVSRDLLGRKNVNVIKPVELKSTLNEARKENHIPVQRK